MCYDVRVRLSKVIYASFKIDISNPGDVGRPSWTQDRQHGLHEDLYTILPCNPFWRGDVEILGMKGWQINCVE